MSANIPLFDGIVPTLESYQMNSNNEGFTIAFPEDASLDGLIRSHQRRTQATVEMLFVHTERRGLGTRLMESFFAYCISREVEIFESDIIHPGALVIVGRLFDEDALSISDDINGEMVELPISLAQAIQSSERANIAAEQNHTDRLIDVGFKVVAHIDDVVLSNPVSPTPVPYQSTTFNPYSAQL